MSIVSVCRRSLGFFVPGLRKSRGQRRKLAREEEDLLKTRLLASGLFDPQFYLQENPDVAAAGFDPATHYIQHGWIDGRSPGPAFDVEFYLDTYPDLRASSSPSSRPDPSPSPSGAPPLTGLPHLRHADLRAKVNPILHYLQNGHTEGRTIRPGTALAPRPKAPDPSAWEELAKHWAQRPRSTPTVDIIVPVYSGFDETANCLYAVSATLLATTLSAEIVVIDDQSPEPELSRLLDYVADLRLITLVRHDKNQGFPFSVNRGTALHHDRDVILLNADTEVYGDWIDRLHRAAYSDANIATVTPFSNNATICSYPYFDRNFRGAFELSFKEIDRLASKVNSGQLIDIPTGIGFCMYIRRACLDGTSPFDANAFGVGYGEENDFCQRIAARGWRNVLAGNVFVRHLGGISFRDSTNQRIRKALQIVNDRYPHYGEDVQRYLKHDPPKPLRRNIDIARLRRAAGEHSVLFVVHRLDGGTLRHVNELSRLLVKEGVGTFLLQPCAGHGNFGDLSHDGIRDLSVVSRLGLLRDLPAAATLISDLGIMHIHVHHLLGFSPVATHFVKALARKVGIAYDFTAHDYTPACPRVNMIDGSGIYCNNGDIPVCESCLMEHGSPFGNVSVWLWREAYEHFMQGARKLFVPNQDVKTRLEAFFPSLDFTVRPHPERIPDTFGAPVHRQPGQTLRVAVIGAIGPHKGSLQLLRCAEDAARRRLPIKFVLVGFADISQIRDLPTVEIIGRYNDDDLPKLLERTRCHLSFFPSVWPETYSFTLSEAFFAGLYPVAFDIGAIAHRIRAAGWGCILPFELVWQASKVNEILLSCQVPPRPPEWKPVMGEMLYKSMVADYYGFDGFPRACDSV
jgi:O-antigen biosynthesis protein